MICCGRGAAYLGGGILLGRQQGRSGTGGLLEPHPLHAKHLQLAGLVQDGFRFLVKGGKGSAKGRGRGTAVAFAGSPTSDSLAARGRDSGGSVRSVSSSSKKSAKAGKEKKEKKEKKVSHKQGPQSFTSAPFTNSAVQKCVHINFDWDLPAADCHAE